MEDGMFHPANVLIHRHPVLLFVKAPGFLFVLRIRIPQEIPGGVQEGIHGIQFSFSRTATRRTSSVMEGLAGHQGRFSLSGKFHICGKEDRQIFFFFRYPSAFFTVDHRNRSSPVPLS